MSASGELYDITIVGGGPVGLYGLYTAGMRGMRAKVIDALPELGGQVTAMYPEKYIYDVGGFPKVLGKTFIQGCKEQGLAAKPTVVLNETVQHLERLPQGTFRLITDKGEHLTRTVVFAVGIGAFRPKTLPAPGVKEFEGRGVSYFVTDIGRYAGKRVLIVGGGDSAVDWANMLKTRASRVTLIHRRGEFRAHEGSVQEMMDGKVDVRTFHELKEIRGVDRVTGATIYDNRTKAETSLDLDEVILSLGFTADLGPIKECGLRFENDLIVVNTKMETNIPGVYGAGDCVTYPGKLKLIATGFGEAAIAVNMAKTFIDPQAKAFPGHSSTRGG